MSKLKREAIIQYAQPEQLDGHCSKLAIDDDAQHPNGQTLVIERFIFLKPTSTETTRTWPSGPGHTSVTRPSGQLPLGELGSITRTTSPTARSRCLWCHFACGVRVGTHSLSQRRQKNLSTSGHDANVASMGVLHHGQ